MTESHLMSIKATGLHKRFTTRDGIVHAVKDVSLQLSAGDFVALHGPSGCGKSTLLLMLGALLTPDQGDVEMAGKNPYQGNAEDRAAFRADHLGFVFQQFHLIPYLDVLENVLVGALAGSLTESLAGASQRSTAFLDRAHELLETFHLGHRLHHVPSALSVGEQQRVSLARALLRTPPLLLADEPTGNLDSANSEIILNQLSGYASAGGTVIMATHDPQARAAANTSIRLDEGQVVT